MKFGPTPVDMAVGGVVAHAVRRGELVLKKGVVVTPEHARALRTAGVTEIVVAIIEPDDLDENAAAGQLARAVAGPGVVVDEAFTGRANLFAEDAGLLIVERTAIDAANMVDEAITVATLAPMKKVSVGEMIGTVKIIPFAVPGRLIAEASAMAPHAISLAPFRALKVGVISTILPGLKPSVIDKTLAALDERLQGLAHSTLHHDARVPHETEALEQALRHSVGLGVDLVVVFGASAITDRRDVVPAAIERAGGRIEHLGMPVDPGNLLLIGEIAGLPVIGAPGCARSPKENGFDWVLQRLSAGLEVTRHDIQSMGVGGLLMEIFSRPQPRSPAVHANHPQVAAVVLAAGHSTRLGRNKLLERVGGKPVVRHVVEAALASRAGPAIVVLGHQAREVAMALVGLDVTFVENPDHASGMASSLRTGVDAVPDTCAAALVLLGDMPLINTTIINRLVDNYAGEPLADGIVPVADGRRANPVLLSRALFDAVASLEGDTGARGLLARPGVRVIEVSVDDDAVLVDVDTEEALARARALSAR
ncbi:MAG: molybdopterin-binding/glycosyltransferase family 2 protein [Hyphomicrobiales bacterium]|nr:molybdopterin-binding/glycosyltransferase family 2 protein [Hyphomicrobiales bacterium]